MKAAVVTDEFMRRVRRRKVECSYREGVTWMDLEKITDQLAAIADKLTELVLWLERARRELRNALPGDERWATVRQVERGMETLNSKMEAIQICQEVILTKLLESCGPLAGVQEDGSVVILSAVPLPMSAHHVLLPKELLDVWRISRVFDGRVELQGPREKLKFGDYHEKIDPKELKKKANIKGVTSEGGLALELEEKTDGLKRS